jgi:hypothetical protein
VGKPVRYTSSKIRFVWRGSAETLLAKLGNAIDPPSWPTWSYPTTARPIMGLVTGKRVELRLRQELRSGGGFSPVFRAEVVTEANNCTVLEGHFTIAPWLKLVVGVWFAGVLTAASCNLILYSGRTSEAVSPVVTPLVMLVGGLFVVVGRWWFAAPQRDQIIAFLELEIGEREC